MSEDNPPPSRNPFIRFKQHIDSRIGNGISFITGSSPPPPTTTTPSTDQAEHSHQQHQQQQPPSGPSVITTNTASHNMVFGGGPPFGGGHFGGHFGGGHSMNFWNDWSQLSPYSPYNLRHLRQPVPSDLPAGVDAKSFGFEDAFEDLMAVSAGRQMMDLSRQARMKKDFFDLFGVNEPPMNWARRLRHEGLLPRPLPPWAERSWPGWRDRDCPQEDRPAWARELANKGRDTDSWEAMTKEEKNWLSVLEGRRPEGDGTESSFQRELRELKKEYENDPVAAIYKFLEFTGESAKKFEQEVERHSNQWINRQSARQVPKEDQQQQQQQQQSQPSTETDLFEFVWNTVARADKTFNDFAKIFMEPPRPLNENAAATTTTTSTAITTAPKDTQVTTVNGKTTRTTTETDESGGKTVRSESEWVDPAGFRHSDIEVVVMDANGRVIGQENRSHVTYAAQNQMTWSGGDDSTTSVSQTPQQQTSTSNSHDGKSTGWFWR